MMIAITLIIIFVVALIVLIFNWFSVLYTDDPYIKFEKFLKLYNKDSSEWELLYAHVKFKKYFFNFKLIDYYMYRHWKRKLDKRQKEEKLQKLYDEIFKEVNKDENT